MRVLQLINKHCKIVCLIMALFTLDYNLVINSSLPPTNSIICHWFRRGRYIVYDIILDTYIYIMSIHYKCSTYYDDRRLLICIHRTFYNHFACIGVIRFTVGLDNFPSQFFLSVYPQRVHNAIIKMYGQLIYCSRLWKNQFINKPFKNIKLIWFFQKWHDYQHRNVGI